MSLDAARRSACATRKTMSTEAIDSAKQNIRNEIEALAVLLITGDLSHAAVLGEAVNKAEAVYQGAVSAALEDVTKFAGELVSKLSKARQAGGTEASLDAELHEMISRLQDAAAKDTPPAPVNALAQDPELVGDFLLESSEHLASIEAQLLTLERDPANSEAIHSIFRAFHTIKGLAGFLDFHAIRDVAHEVETLLDKARNNELAITPAVVDIVLESADYLRGWMAHIKAELAGNHEPAPLRNEALECRIRQCADPAAPTAQPPSAASGLLVLSEAVGAQQAAKQRTVATSSDLRAIKVDTAKLDYLVEMVGEMVISQSLISHDPEITRMKNPRLLRNMSQAMRITGEVQKTAMAMRMVPVGTLFQRNVRLVSDLARKAGKKLELVIDGEETELDRTIVEDLADPLMHMVRNAADHGIESPAERATAGKPAVARIALRASHQGGNIIIEVSDDGRGLNREKILKKAREKGLIEGGDHLPDSEVFQLIFAPGFSTAEQITDISGRGVGMDVVRKNIQKMRGRIDIQSEPGQGTTFLIKLPLTLAIIDGLVVGVGQERYIVPMFAVHETLRPTKEMISVLPSGSEMALIRGKVIPVLRLSRQFGVTPRSEEIAESLMIICEGQGRRFCAIVDDLIGKQEVVIKNLGKTFKGIPGIAGGAILGDGRVGLILDMDGIARAADHAQSV